MTRNADDQIEPPELLVSVNDDPHMYVNNVGKPMRRIAFGILLILFFMLGAVAVAVIADLLH